MAMRTDIVKISDDLSDLRPVIEQLTNGEIVALPTETVYGLAANVFNVDAVRQIFQIKERPFDNPLIVHVSSMKMVSDVAESIPKGYFPLIHRFWPGPLTIVLKKCGHVPLLATAGLDTVTVRMPSHPATSYIIEQCGFPLAMPSANKSGGPSPTKASHVFDDLGGKIRTIVDGGSCKDGLESTIINLLCSPPVVLRPGTITLEMLQQFIPNIQIHSPDPSEMPAICPGLKYIHYSPRTRVVLVMPTVFLDSLTSSVSQYPEGRWGILANSTSSKLYKMGMDLIRVSNGSPIMILTWDDPSLKKIGQDLFEKLRYIDTVGLDTVFIEAVEETQEGIAIMNRLSRASSSILE